MLKNLKIKKASQKNKDDIINLLSNTDYAFWIKDVDNYLSDNSYSFYLVEKDKKILGLILVKAVLDEAEIYLVYVDPNSRNKKIGSFLLESVLSDLKDSGIRVIFLEVNEENKAAIKLYTNYGFELNRVRENYYKDLSALELKLEI